MNSYKSSSPSFSKTLAKNLFSMQAVSWLLSGTFASSFINLLTVDLVLLFDRTYPQRSLLSVLIVAARSFSYKYFPFLSLDITKFLAFLYTS